MQRVYLLRHAAPEGDFATRYLGSTDPELSPEGVAQAGSVLTRYPACVGLRVRSSPLRRAWQTASLAFPGVLLQVVSSAIEISFGVLDGELPATAARLYPEAVHHVARHPLDAGPIGGESWSALLHRAQLLADTLGIESQIIVSHQYFLLALLACLLGPQRRAEARPLGYAEAMCCARRGAAEPWEVVAP